jgi:hypothetical protein
MRLTLVFLVGLAVAASLEDQAVIAVMRRVDGSAARVQVLRRAPVDEKLDAVVTLGQKLGLALQERQEPGRVYLVASEPAIRDCSPKVERVSATEVIGSCGSEKFERRPNWKFLFDSRAKALVQYYSYPPFSVYRIFPRGDGAVFLACDRERVLAVAYDGAFRVMGAAEARVWIARVHVSVGAVGFEMKRVISIEPDKTIAPDIPLRQTTYDEFAAARPERVKNGYVRAGTEVHDGIGPWKKDGERIWFGKSFYDGEGSTGVGGFGYLESATGKYKLLSPPEIADWSVSAMFVGPEAVWMGLVWNGETGNSSGGLLRFDRASETVARFAFPDVAFAIERAGDRVLVAGDSGIGIVEDGRVRRFFLDRMSDGRWRVVEAK